MNKKAIVLLLCSMLTIPVLTGCESNTETGFSLFNVEIESDKSEEALETFLNSDFEVTLDNQTYKINTKECIEFLGDVNIQWDTEKINENEYFIIASMEGGEYIKFVIQLDTKDILIAEIGIDGGDQIIRGETAIEVFKDLLMEYILATQDVALDYNCAYCGQQMKQSFVDGEWEDDFCSQECQDRFYEEQKQVLEKQKEEANKKQQSTCKWCGKHYDPKNSNAWENEKFCSKDCHVKYEEKQEAKEAEQYKYYCAYCGAGYRPDSSDAEDPYSFCGSGCEYQWYYEQNPGREEDYIDHNPCKGCGKEIGLNGGEGYCHDCNEARYNGWK